MPPPPTPQPGTPPVSASPASATPTKAWRSAALSRRLALPVAASVMLHALGFGALYTFDLLPARARVPLTAHDDQDQSLAIQLSDLPPPPPTPPPAPPPAPLPEPPKPEEPAPEEITPEPKPLPDPTPEPMPELIAQRPAPEPNAPKTAPATPRDVARAPEPSRAEQPRPAASETPAHTAVFASLNAQRATRIVYCVDVSGGMASVLPFLMAELRASVDRLDTDQSFQVVLFRDPPEGSSSRAVQTLFDRGSLLSPSLETKRSLGALLNAERPLGRSNINAGLRRALEMKPTLVFLLTRNFKRTAEPDIDGTLRELDTLNPKGRDGSRPATIKIIQFIEDDPTGLLQAIAKDHGQGDDAYSMLEIEDLRTP